jgi:hypothetical protein
MVRFNANIDQGRMDKLDAYAAFRQLDKTVLLKIWIDSLPDYRSDPPLPGVSIPAEPIGQPAKHGHDD